MPMALSSTDNSYPSPDLPNPTIVAPVYTTNFDHSNLSKDQHLKEVMKHVWGYESFRPMQREAMTTVLQGRDSVVVLPTGGGKSLCY